MPWWSAHDHQGESPNKATMVCCIPASCPAAAADWEGGTVRNKWLQPGPTGRDLLWPRPTLANSFSYFGHDLLWPRPTVATVSPTLATISFGHFRGEEGEERGRARKWSQAWRGRRVGARRGRGRRGGDPNPKGLGREGSGVEAPRRPAGRRSFTLRAKTSTFEVPTDQNTTKIPREDPQRDKKNENGGGRRKKSEILGGPAEGGPAEGGPAEGGPAKGGPAKGGPGLRGPLAHIGLARPKSAQIGQVKGCGQSRPGQSRSWPK